MLTRQEELSWVTERVQKEFDPLINGSITKDNIYIKQISFVLKKDEVLIHVTTQRSAVV